jgi:diguanylate cyclase (GGDEF)-like protein
MVDEITNTADLQTRIGRLEADIEHLSKHDHLTGLMTRAAFINEVDRCFSVDANVKSSGALIEISLQGIPRIAGTLGRHVSDYMISAIAARLNAMQLPGSFKCRLDYSHYAVFLPKLTDALQTMTITKQLLSDLAQPIDWVDRPLMFQLGAGVALAKDNDGDASNLVHHADLALKSAMSRGGPGYAFFNPTLAQSAKRRGVVLQALHAAIDDQSLHLHYQPYYNTQTGALSGFEALMRMTSQELGPVSPVEFIPVAEEASLIGQLGAWALVEACRAAANWPSNLTISVNISPEQFYSGTIVTDVHNALELSSFPAYRLELEVTESTLLKDSEMVLQQLGALRELGCSIVLDDFGTGYSSLSYLWKFPFSKLKIDRAFVQALDTTGMARGMLQSIIGLANNLGLKVTAEGIETKYHAEVLKEFNCDFLQGFLLSKPVAPTELAHLILQEFAPQLKAETHETASLKIG